MFFFDPFFDPFFGPFLDFFVLLRITSRHTGGITKRRVATKLLLPETSGAFIATMAF
jgi:hypothetical protein